MSNLVLDFLSLLEEREARLLTWGFVDGAFEPDELEDLAGDYVLDHDDTGTLTGAHLVRQLRDRALLLDVEDGGARRYRTRMAETVRLAARLRQLFPKHRDAGWARAPTLVADFRIVTRPRAYPKRDIPVPAALAELDLAGAPVKRGAALRRLLDGRAASDFGLSRFQVDAAREILAGLDARRTGGTIIGAGTGSGKTLAFYLPALSHVVASRDESGTRILAIYPRIELLRDQLAEAFREARRLDGVGGTAVTIRVGALYGSTPWDAAAARRMWRPRGEDRICPYLLCPVCSEGTLVWPRQDLDAGVPRLVCSLCAAVVDDRHLALTRAAMRDAPPEVLFTTTEMLNRTLMDGRLRHVIGVGPSAAPIDLVLLDEVHTYEGTTGAHVAGVLRRWRHARRRPVHFVGLSATLREAAGFFASLTGLATHQVTAIEPRETELEYEGREYLLALRSDPHSGASVLSTTIQASMLLQRALDPLGGGPSDGAIGQRLFAFTDDLDVTNRLFFDLLDAEGLNSWGQPEKASLATLRAPVGTDLEARRDGAQSWEALERIGHTLDEHAHMRIGRTTSQDADVDRGATAIVATSSLEVGFNDPLVGAVLQHKSPHDAAAFLQRKGRAGRARGMRPWTVAVLSDFGRDRLTYQSYERLFDPELSPRSLPVANPAVVRMQAVFATLDWLAGRLGRRALIWQLLQRPSSTGRWAERDREMQLRLAELLSAVVRERSDRAELVTHLEQALDLDAAEVEELLWEPPRPLLTTALPTAIRRLRTDWRHLTLGPRRDHVGDGPLPEFIVSRLFGDLALPEIIVVTPPQTRREEERREPMRAVQALTAYAPGRVSHRLTIAHRGARHWIAPPPLEADGTGRLDVQSFVTEFEDLGTFAGGTSRSTRIVRPSVIAVTTPPSEVLSSSHGRLRWEAEHRPTATSDQVLHPPAASPLAPLVDTVSFFTHGALAHTEVRRWAPACDLETATQSVRTRGRVDFVDARDGAPVALGLALDVDAVAIDVRVPGALVTGRALHATHMGGLRVERFREQFAKTPVIRRALGTFDAQRVADALLVTLLAEADERQADVASVFAALRERDALHEVVGEALDRGASGEAEYRAERRRELVEALRAGPIADALEAAAAALWQEPDTSWDGWAAGRLATSVGAAFHTALQELCPEYDADDLVVDLEAPDPNGGDLTRVWISEQTVGGGGLLQEALRRIGDRPRRFFDLVVAAAEPSLDETVDAELRSIALALGRGGALSDPVASVRDARSHTERTAAFDALLVALEAAGVFVCHPVVAALSVRALRPGATRDIDMATAELLERWDELERRSELDVDLGTFAELAARDDAFDRASRLSAPATDPTGWRAGQITGLLWPRGAAVRALALRAPNPFTPLPTPDPLLLRGCLSGRAEAVPVERLAEARARRWAAGAHRRGRNSRGSQRCSAAAPRAAAVRCDSGRSRRPAALPARRRGPPGPRRVAGPARPRLGRRMSARQIFKGRARAEREVENLLQSILAAELLAPSEVLWIVSPWISDVGVLDNTTGGFAGLEPTWGRRSITLVEVLAALLRRGSRVVVATRTDDHNLRFVRRLQQSAESAGLRGRLLVVLDERERLHEKGIVGDDFYLSGSMNVTYNGIRLHDEAVRFELDDEVVAGARVNFRRTYGVPLG